MKQNILGNTGLLVSELCFGTMTFGGRGYWQAIGQQQLDEAKELTQAAFDGGITFFDCANAYSEGEAERLLGHSIAQLGLPRQQLVVATKVLLRMGPGANQVGLSRGHIADSVADSLQRLGLDYIDLLYIHGVDPLTPLEETMRGLEDVVRSGRVRYLGACNLPAWQVMKANGIAAHRGYTPFSALQYFYSLADRHVEHEIVPLALDQKMSLFPWSPLAGGYLSGKFTVEQPSSPGARRDGFDFPPIDKPKALQIVQVMQGIAAQLGATVAQVALAWLLQQPTVHSVIIGAKTLAQLHDNLGSTQLQLSTEHLQALHEASHTPAPYPHWMVARQASQRLPQA